MRLRALLFLALPACGADIQPPVTPKNVTDNIREGDIGSALDACRRGDCTDDQRTEVAKMVFAQKKPQLDVRVLSDDEIVERFGGRTARHVLAEHFAIDLKLTAPVFDRAAISFVPETDAGKLPRVASDAEHLSPLTGEHYPAPHEWKEWAVAHVPYPKVEGLGTLALAAAEVMIVGPIQLLSLHRETRIAPPTDEEIRAAVPLAVKLRDATAVRHDGAAFVQTVFVARPEKEGPLVLHTVVELGMFSNTLGAQLDVRVDGGSGHAELLKADVIALSALPPATCDAGACTFGPLAPARVVTIGLTVPDVPKDLGTPDASDKAKPYWTTDSYAPERLFDGAIAAKDEEARLIVCKMKTISVPGEDADDVYALANIGKRTYKRFPRDFMSFPLVRIAPNGMWSLSLWDVDWLSGDDWLSTVSFRRSGANVVRTVSPKLAETDLACTVHARPAIEKEFMTRWLTAMDELESMDRIVRIDLGKTHFGLERRATAVGAIEGMAALVGWDDPRMRPLVERIAAHEKNFGLATKAALEGWSKEHATTDLKVNGIRCGKDAKIPSQADHAEYKHTKCVVDVETAPGTTLRNVRVVLTDGRSVAVDTINGNRTMIPTNVPAFAENEKPWAVAFESKETLGVAFVP
jgi:hypothetical protein